jgi:hypothetical protein
MRVGAEALTILSKLISEEPGGRFWVDFSAEFQYTRRRDIGIPAQKKVVKLNTKRNKRKKARNETD